MRPERTQHVLVLQAQGGDDGQGHRTGLGDIGGILEAPQACLHHRTVRLRPCTVRLQDSLLQARELGCAGQFWCGIWQIKGVHKPALAMCVCADVLGERLPIRSQACHAAPLSMPHVRRVHVCQVG